MPHLIIEYSANACAVDQLRKVVQAAHEVMVQSGLFSLADIKTRAYRAEHFMLGGNGEQGSFMHATVALLEGRSVAQRQALSEAVRDALQRHVTVDQLSVEVREMAKDTYRKFVHA